MKTTTKTGAAKKTICMFTAGQSECPCERCQAETKRIANVEALPAVEGFKGATVEFAF